MMTASQKVQRLSSVEKGLLSVTDALSRTMNTASSDQASYVSGALVPLSRAINLVKEARYTDDASGNPLLREAMAHLDRALLSLQPVSHIAPVSQLRSIAEDLKALGT